MHELTEDLDLGLEGYADLMAGSINAFNVSTSEMYEIHSVKLTLITRGNVLTEGK